MTSVYIACEFEVTTTTRTYETVDEDEFVAWAGVPFSERTDALLSEFISSHRDFLSPSHRAEVALEAVNTVMWSEDITYLGAREQ